MLLIILISLICAIDSLKCYKGKDNDVKPVECLPSITSCFILKTQTGPVNFGCGSCKSYPMMICDKDCNTDLCNFY